MAGQRSVDWPAEPGRSTVSFGSSEHFFQPLLSHLQNMAGQPSLFRSDIIHESNFVKQPASLGRSTVSDLNLPASAGQPSLLGVENIFMNAFTSEKWRLTCHVLQVTVQWLKKVLATLKTDGWPARFCRSFNWRLTCHIWQVYPQENLWINLPASAGQPSLFSPAIYGRNSQVYSYLWGILQDFQTFWSLSSLLTYLLTYTSDF